MAGLCYSKLPVWLVDYEYIVMLLNGSILIVTFQNILSTFAPDFL
jgi:hypothetical protein